MYQSSVYLLPKLFLVNYNKFLMVPVINIIFGDKWQGQSEYAISMQSFQVPQGEERSTAFPGVPQETKPDSWN